MASNMFSTMSLINVIMTYFQFNYWEQICVGNALKNQQKAKKKKKKNRTPLLLVTPEPMLIS